FNHRLINSAGALAASHHKDRHEIFLESEFLTRLPSIQTHKLGPDWSACNFCVCFWKKRRAFLKAEHDRADYSRCQTVGFSRHGVRLVNKGGNAAHPPGQYRRCRSESPHAQNDLRLKCPVNRPAKRQDLVRTTEETEKCRRKWRRHFSVSFVVFTIAWRFAGRFTGHLSLRS